VLIFDPCEWLTLLHVNLIIKLTIRKKFDLRILKLKRRDLLEEARVQEEVLEAEAEALDRKVVVEADQEVLGKILEAEVVVVHQSLILRSYWEFLDCQHQLEKMIYEMNLVDTVIWRNASSSLTKELVDLDVLDFYILSQLKMLRRPRKLAME